MEDLEDLEDLRSSDATIRGVAIFNELSNCVIGKA